MQQAFIFFPKTAWMFLTIKILSLESYLTWMTIVTWRWEVWMWRGVMNHNIDRWHTHADGFAGHVAKGFEVVLQHVLYESFIPAHPVNINAFTRTWWDRWRNNTIPSLFQSIYFLISLVIIKGCCWLRQSSWTAAIGWHELRKCRKLCPPRRR